MTQKTLYSPDKYSAYPGQYIASSLTLEELLDELQQPHETESKPLVNIVEVPDAYIIEMAAPGLKKSDFYVSIEGNILTVSFLHKDNENKKKMYCLQEFNYCCFRRDIIVPGNVDADFLSAEYKNGILIVRVPKSKKQVINNVERIIIY